MNCQVDVEPMLMLMGGALPFQHCKDDEVHLFPGPITAWSEEHPGQWVPIGFPNQ
jgi:hypothetical protein